MAFQSSNSTDGPADLLRKIVNNQVEAGASPGGGGTWGSITGTLGDQTDLQAALDAKSPIHAANLAAFPPAGEEYDGQVYVADDTDKVYICGKTAIGDWIWSEQKFFETKDDLLTYLGLGTESSLGVGSIQLYTDTGAYDATGWNGNDTVPTKKAIRDKIESMGSGGARSRSIVYIPPTNTVTFTNLQAAATLFASSGRYVCSADLTNFTQVRLSVRVDSVAGNSGSKVILRYYTSRSLTASDYIDIGASEVSVAISGSTLTTVDSSWINLVAGAKADVFVALITSGGDGASDPVIGATHAEFR